MARLRTNGRALLPAHEVGREPDDAEQRRDRTDRAAAPIGRHERPGDDQPEPGGEVGGGGARGRGGVAGREGAGAERHRRTRRPVRERERRQCEPGHAPIITPNRLWSATVLPPLILVLAAMWAGRSLHTVAIRSRWRGADHESATHARPCGGRAGRLWRGGDGGRRSEPHVGDGGPRSRVAAGSRSSASRRAIRRRPRSSRSAPTARDRAAGHPARDRRDGQPAGLVAGRLAARVRALRHPVRHLHRQARRLAPAARDARSARTPAPASRRDARTAGTRRSFPTASGSSTRARPARSGRSPTERSGSSTPTSSCARSTGPTRGCCSAPGRTRPSTREPASRPTARSSST